MSRFVEHLTDAWGEYWSGGDARAAGLIYGADVAFWNVARGRTGEVVGVDAVSGERFALLTRSDRAGVVVSTTLVDGPIVVVEFVLTTAECGAPAATPGCAWWWVDDQGRITREEWWLDPAAGGPASPEIAGRPLRSDAPDPGPEHRRRLVERIVEAGDADPMARVGYAADAVVDRMGADPASPGVDTDVAERTTTVHALAGSGPFVAWTEVTVEVGSDGAARTRPTAHVAVLDRDGRIAGEHVYRLRPWSTRAHR